MSGPAQRLRSLIEDLTALRGAFGKTEARRRRALLEACRALPLRGPARLIGRYHDLLLFAAAHPDDPAVESLAAEELVRAAGACGPRLPGSGILGSTIEASFSIDLMEWLARRFPAGAGIAWDGDSAGEGLDDLLPALAARGEADGLLAPELSTREWVELARGAESAAAAARTSDLAWLAARARGLGCTPSALDLLMAQADVPVRWHLADPAASTTLGRFPPRPIHYDRGPLERRPDLRRLMADALPAPAPLSVPQRRELVDAARCALAVRQRETDPVTYANDREVELFRLERGLDVLLLGLQPARRLPVESFFGYVAARNRVPVAYGGGWVFLDRAEIGVNVFDAFRGGESARIFGQILRVYRGHYGVRRFSVDPYQLGEDNEEGLRSGAYWFYYRLGFRPQDAEARDTAAQEWARLGARRGARTPRKLLRGLVASGLALDCPGPAPAPGSPDLARLGVAVTSWIGRRFDGDRGRAEAWARKRAARALGAGSLSDWPAEERAAFEALAPVVAMIEGLESWPAAARRDLVAVMRAKGGPRERDYAGILRRHGLFCAALARIARPPA